MYRTLLALTAVALLALNGALHGLRSQRWSGLTEPAVQAAGDRLRGVPMKLGSDWVGEPIAIDRANLPEEVIGRNLAVRYTHRTSGQEVVVYLACGHTPAMLRHTPLECYPAHGYQTVAPEARVAPPGAAPGRPEFWAATFSGGESPVPLHLRVFWAWKGAGPWQAPDNPGRTFGASPFLYKCYAIRQLATPDEPLEGDPALDCLNDLVAELNTTLAGS